MFNMEFLQDTIVLNFRPDTLKVVREKCNLHKPGQMSAAVDILEDWVKKQNHFLKKDFSRSYLERAIIDAKGSVERAKDRLEKLCTFRTLMPQYFGDYNIMEDFQELDGQVSYSVLRQLTENHQRVIVIRNVGQTFEQNFLLQVNRISIMAIEYLKAHDYNNGYIVLFDHSEINWMALLSKLHFSVCRQYMTILLEGYGVKVKGIHFLTSSSLVELFVTTIKQFISAKIANRVRVHTSIDTLYDYIPKEILPLDYGGKERSLHTLYEVVRDTMSAREQRDYVKEMCNAGTNESLRQTNTFNDIYMGTPGTFRTLNLD